MRRGMLSRGMWVAVLGALLFLSGTAFAQQGFRVGQVVTTNFSLVNRYAWTNAAGRVFTPGDSAMRLSDFDGQIVFLELFAVW